MIPIKETFLSIQGEGLHAGKSAFFIRTQGCDVGCGWCDEPKSWDLNAGEKKSTIQLIEEVKNLTTKIIIFTGGEPLMHNLSDITFEMKKLGFSLHIETSGAYPLSGKWDWITLSPKKRKPPMEEIYLKASELKVVIFNDRDFLWAQDQEKKVSKKCLLYLQPEWNKFEKMKSKIFNFISENPRWRLSLQMHKYLHIQ
tara:strand:+ start:359 stop:952 length:594 start_codon:yes stop_codon:yes gene_type:complete